MSREDLHGRQLGQFRAAGARFTRRRLSIGHDDAAYLMSIVAKVGISMPTAVEMTMPRVVLV